MAIPQIAFFQFHSLGDFDFCFPVFMHKSLDGPVISTDPVTLQRRVSKKSQRQISITLEENLENLDESSKKIPKEWNCRKRQFWIELWKYLKEAWTGVISGTGIDKKLLMKLFHHFPISSIKYSRRNQNNNITFHFFPEKDVISLLS